MSPNSIDRYEIIYSRKQKFKFVKLDDEEDEFSGLLATYLDGESFDDLDIKGLHIVNVKGFPEVREYYSPSYDSNLDLSRVPDFRNLLYWHPEIELSEDGKASVEFFTSDLIGEFSIEIEGVINGTIPFHRTVPMVVGEEVVR